VTDAPAVRSRNPFRRLYLWILTWAHHPWGTWALAVFAFVDSSVFPIPPVFLQVALSLERPRRSWWYATVDLVGSIFGAMIGYLIGALLYDTIGKWLIDTWGYRKQFDNFGELLKDHAFWFTFFYAFIPVPYKILTIGTGFFRGSLPLLLLASSLGRALRFYSLAAICYWKGAAAKDFIDHHFNKVLIGVGLFVALILIVMKVWFGGDRNVPDPGKKTAVRLAVMSLEAPTGIVTKRGGRESNPPSQKFAFVLRRDSDPPQPAFRRSPARAGRRRMPGEGIEPSWPLAGPGDFKSPASACSATPARRRAAG
jgi:membrane protein YqaA with SNARE-associated domain